MNVFGFSFSPKVYFVCISSPSFSQTLSVNSILYPSARKVFLKINRSYLINLSEIEVVHMRVATDGLHININWVEGNC